MRTSPGKTTQAGGRPETPGGGGTLLRRCAALALLPLLSGCVAAAAVAVPAMTAAGVITKRDPATPKIEVPDVAAAEAEQEATPTTATVLMDGAPALTTPVPQSETAAELTSFTELPAPSPADVAGDPWRGFVAYALNQSAELAGPPGAGPAESALLSTEGISNLTAQRRPCGGTDPAVIIDLDEGPAAFSPENAGTPSPGLAEALARLREAGVVVMWISSADANQVKEVADALRRTGLDPDGRDPLLLRLGEDARKQTLREEANEGLCVVAVAGDQRADFDELFDYLRNPDAAVGLDALIGSGWFVTPLPLASSAAGAE